jgi:glycosyltransferase involved in cell wall biosynthesis
MIKVGFIGMVSKEWMGGLNYYKNLLFALNNLEKKELEIFVFVGKKTDEDIKNMFGLYAKVIEDNIFDKWSVKWFFSKVEQYFFGSNFIHANLFSKYNIQVLSHTSLVNVKHTKTINWIPDFQHMHLPAMFSLQEIDKRNKKFKKLIKKSDSILLSSYDALNDFTKFSTEPDTRVRVLQFVSQPSEPYFDLNDQDKDFLLEKYKLLNDFFYIPNQFWKHKNHLLVFQAINALKKEGIEIYVVCSGYLDDYRNKNYINEIKSFIDKNDLHENIRLLGLIEYQDVFALIKFSKAVINPSLFEGWSSTVEECKSINKSMILSDLDVHMEQYATAVFFKRNDLDSLKSILKNYSGEKNESNISSTLEIRTKKFAEKYVSICLEMI